MSSLPSHMHTSTAGNPISPFESHHRKPFLSVRIAPPEALFSVRFASLMRYHRHPLAFPPPPPPASVDSTPQLSLFNPTKISLISPSICFR
ncbi:hypothetical protein CsSME_00042803 [Camellia sinensis var. sinensis]